MPRSRRSTAHLAGQLTELAFATPQVMAMRLARMAAAGQSPTARDRAEMQRMGSEKVAAFWQSWMAMWMDWWLMPMRLAPAFTGVLGGGARSHGAWQRAMAGATTGLLAAGLAPVHRTAVANAKRLSRRR